MNGIQGSQRIDTQCFELTHDQLHSEIVHFCTTVLISMEDILQETHAFHNMDSAVGLRRGAHILVGTIVFGALAGEEAFLAANKMPQ